MAKAINDKEQKEEMINAVYLSYTSCYFNFNGKEYSLHNNETYQLPACPFVRSLIGQGKLVEKK